ncbi:hypothetical protein ACIQVA_20325 [Streptomyces microflavus]|uniref:hypothetical protein n=1 Tax=Streptomyces microflavus TaxID=1919 RepID=UPI00382182F8
MSSGMHREQNGEYRYYGQVPFDAQQRLDREHREQERRNEPVEQPRPSWSPGPAPGAAELSPFLPPLPQAPPAQAVVPVDVSQVTWQPDAETAAVIQELNAPHEMFAAPPPAHVGDNPAFDAFFDKLTAETASTQAALDTLLSIEPTQPGF